MKKPIIVERYADNGAFSHYALINEETGDLLWSEAPKEEMQKIVAQANEADTSHEQASHIADVSTSICQHCGKVEGNWCINPYIEEINGEEVWEYICPDCYHELCMDI